MGVVILDGSTVKSFVADEAAFARGVDERFAALDLNGDGVLSRAELRRALETFRLFESHFGAEVITPSSEVATLYDSIFEQFDTDHSGSIDRNEFREEMKKIMLAIADGLGSSPVQMVMDDENSLLQEAVDLEAKKMAVLTGSGKDDVKG
ncbi:calcium-binding EF-hand family protein [Carex rostrata]